MHLENANNKTAGWQGRAVTMLVLAAHPSYRSRELNLNSPPGPRLPVKHLGNLYNFLSGLLSQNFEIYGFIYSLVRQRRKVGGDLSQKQPLMGVCSIWG